MIVPTTPTPCPYATTASLKVNNKKKLFYKAQGLKLIVIMQMVKISKYIT